MIQAAHIGVGLYGQEGMRAVQAADFAIPEFKALWRLLFVHGRWCYIRIAEMVLYFFYKNMVFTLPLFYFCFVSAFSGQTLFDSWYISLYNTIFTLLPVVAKACFEQDVYYKKIVYETQEKKKVLKVVELTNVRKSYPLLYSGGVGSKAFSLRKFFRSVNKGAFHSVIIFVLTYFSLDRAIVCSDGQVSNFWYFSITVFTSVVLVVDLKLAIYTRYWTVLMWVALIITSIGLYIAYIWFGDTLDANPISRTAAVLFSTLHFYLIVLMNLTIVLLLETMYIYIKKEYDTEAADFIVSLVKNHNEDDQTKFDRIEKEILLERKKKSQASPHKLSSVPDFNITKSEKLPNNRGVTINLESSPSPLRRPSIDQLINKFSGHQRRNSKSSPQNRLVSEDGLYKDTEEGREGQTNLQNGRHFAHSNQQKPEDTENKMTEQINSTHSIGRSPNDISLQGSIAEERPTSRIFSQLFRSLNFKNPRSSPPV